MFLSNTKTNTVNTSASASASVSKQLPIDCIGNWTTWSACEPIGNNEKGKSRSYKIIKLPQNGGTYCDVSNNTIETIKCVDCIGNWTTWSTCGPIQNNESTKLRTYKIETLPQNGGTNCDVSNNIIETIKCELNVYPPIKEPSRLDGSSTDITVEYDNEVDNRYQIRTSFTYEYWGGNIRHLVDNNNSTSWGSLYNVYFPGYSGGNYLVNDIKGEWIYYKLPKPISLYKYSISADHNRPCTWVFYGSNNGTSWTEISNASQKDKVYQNNYLNNTYTKILDNNTELYQYFGIVITSITDGPGDYAAYVSNIRFYGI
jgi:hypothetical protein